MGYSYCVTWGDPHIRGFFKKFDDAKTNGDRTLFKIHNIIVSTSQQKDIFNEKATITHFEVSVDGNAFTVTRDDIRDETSFGKNHVTLTKEESFEQWPRSKFPGRFDNMMTFDAAPDFTIFWVSIIFFFTFIWLLLKIFSMTECHHNAILGHLNDNQKILGDVYHFGKRTRSVYRIWAETPPKKLELSNFSEPSETFD